MRSDGVTLPRWAVQAGGWLLAALLLGFGGLVIDNAVTTRQIVAGQAALVEAVGTLKGEVIYLRTLAEVERDRDAERSGR